MRDARDGITLLAKLRDWAALLELVGQSPGGRDALFVLLRCVSIVTDDLHFEEFRDILKTQSATGESLTMTLAEQFLADGQVASLLAVLETRGLFVPEYARDRIESTADRETLLAAPNPQFVRSLRCCKLGASSFRRERISATTDLTTLEDWVVRAVTASCVDDVFRTEGAGR